MPNRFAKHSFLLVLLVALLAGALLGVSCHLIWADHGHDPSSCAVCTWFHFKGWISAALVLLVCLALQHFVCTPLPGGFSLSAALHPARAPPRR
jgi:hypothetical protein